VCFISCGGIKVRSMEREKKHEHNEGRWWMIKSVDQTSREIPTSSGWRVKHGSFTYMLFVLIIDSCVCSVVFFL
jgi:hypothetical protein